MSWYFYIRSINRPSVKHHSLVMLWLTIQLRQASCGFGPSMFVSWYDSRGRQTMPFKSCATRKLTERRKIATVRNGKISDHTPVRMYLRKVRLLQVREWVFLWNLKNYGDWHSSCAFSTKHTTHIIEDGLEFGHFITITNSAIKTTYHFWLRFCMTDAT